MAILNHKSLIMESIGESDWDFGNKILYELCENYPEHKKVDVVVAKMLFIGRIYAAAIERRRNKNEINDDFYIRKVAPTIIASELDSRLRNLKDSEELNNDVHIIEILRTHKYLSDVFNRLTGLDKRSLSSKYLHFHKPNMFFIYDSRAVSALRKFISKVPYKDKQIIYSDGIDKEYGKFYIKALSVKNEIEQKLNIKLSYRDFDKVLINIANSNKNIKIVKNREKIGTAIGYR